MAKKSKLVPQVQCRLREIRLACGLTQFDLADMTGVSARQISNIENGAQARFSTRRKICCALYGGLGWNRRHEIWPEMMVPAGGNEPC